MRNTFKDSKDREYVVELTTDTLKRLRVECQPPFALEDILAKRIDEKNQDAELEKYQVFIDDDIRFAGVLWVIVKPQADAAGVTQQEFDSCLNGEANQRAILAFHRAFVDFSIPPRSLFLRGLTVMMEKQAKFEKTAISRMSKEADKIDDAKLESIVNGAVDEALSRHAGNSAASSALIQDRSPTAN